MAPGPPIEVSSGRFSAPDTVARLELLFVNAALPVPFWKLFKVRSLAIE